MGYSSGPETLDQPRILCLHGAGVTAEIFMLQMRSIVPALASRYRFVFVDGPFENDMHPDLYPVYDGMGPYRSWSAWKPHHEKVHPTESIDMIEDALRGTMASDPGTGEWVGILGFSQGAKVAFSVLYENQLRRQNGDGLGPFAGAEFKFGVIIAGRAAPYALCNQTLDDPRFQKPGDTSLTSYAPPDAPNEKGPLSELTTPTLHVHGLFDPGLDQHRELYRDWPAAWSEVLVEWAGAHRIPIKTADVKAVTNGVIKTAKKAGAL